MDADSLATRGFLSINPSGSGYEAFSDALATRGYIFLVHEIETIAVISKLFKTSDRVTIFKTSDRVTIFKTSDRVTEFKTSER
jgi:hypothetical protein